jgi:hypothetical protein
MVKCGIDSCLQRGIDCDLLMGERRHEAGATFQSGKLDSDVAIIRLRTSATAHALRVSVTRENLPFVE